MCRLSGNPLHQQGSGHSQTSPDITSTGGIRPKVPGVGYGRNIDSVERVPICLVSRLSSIGVRGDGQRNSQSCKLIAIAAGVGPLVDTVDSEAPEPSPRPSVRRRLGWARHREWTISQNVCAMVLLGWSSRSWGAHRRGNRGIGEGGGGGGGAGAAARHGMPWLLLFR
ncbi:hypothetical protein CKAH01_12861 [Colletotrichum kahawae]|uniref:Uncharacterized protein n=1 Tax=Colletotrichum kahawae TaxID=34407 RepID=A0AAD9YQ23_COLKA|nr:hypothetical protein CKAH01_12861 [Colletotrichum kahawae]